MQNNLQHSHSSNEWLEQQTSSQIAHETQESEKQTETKKGKQSNWKKPQWKKQPVAKPRKQPKKQQQVNQEAEQEEKPLVVAVSERIKKQLEEEKANNPDPVDTERDLDDEIEINNTDDAQYYINVLQWLKANSWWKVLATQLRNRAKEIEQEVMWKISWKFDEKEYILEQLLRMEYRILNEILNQPEKILATIKINIQEFINEL